MQKDEANLYIPKGLKEDMYLGKVYFKFWPALDSAVYFF